MNLTKISARIRNRILVSVEAPRRSPLRKPEFLAAIARASIDAGAAGAMLEGGAAVVAARSLVKAPLAGYYKYPDGRLRCTPATARALALAGADFILVDARTPRLADVILQIRKLHGCGVIAVCGDLKNGVAAAECAPDWISTGLSIFTNKIAAGGAEPDVELVGRLAAALGPDGPPVLAHGHYNSPELAADAFAFGATAVCVESPFARPDLAMRAMLDACPQSGAES